MEKLGALMGTCKEGEGIRDTQKHWGFSVWVTMSEMDHVATHCHWCLVNGTGIPTVLVGFGLFMM